MACRGWRMVVRAGFWKAADWTSSKPTTEMSCGTRRPASRMARMAPMAETSLKAKMAVKRCVVDRRCSVAR